MAKFWDWLIFPQFVLAQEPKVFKLEVPSFWSRPSIFILKGWYDDTPQNNINFWVKGSPHAELKIVGSTGSMLLEQPRLFPGAHETKTHLKAVFIMALYHFKRFFLCKWLHLKFSHRNNCSIALGHLIVQKQWDWIFMPLIEKYQVVIKDSGTESSPFFAPGTPQYFFQLCPHVKLLFGNATRQSINLYLEKINHYRITLVRYWI